MDLKKNQLIHIEITGMTSEGNGVGRYNDFALFVPNSAIGDYLEIRIVKVLKNYGFGKIERIIKPSPNRIDPDCSVYQKCGGCCYRHINYETECKIKENLVKENLKKIGGFEMDIEPIEQSPEYDHYRNKAQYPVARTGEELLIGFYANRSHRIINCTDCKLQPVIFSNILEDIKKFIDTYAISIYDEEKHEGVLRHIYMRIGEHTGEIMVCFIINADSLPNQNDLITTLTEKYDNIKSIVLNINKKNTNVILGNKCKTIFGKSTISDILCNLKFDISPLSFYQVNRKGAENLYTIAKEFANPKKDDILIDLYCGTGTIGLTMAKEVKKLIGVEIIEDAVKNAAINALNNNIANAEFICSDAKNAAEHFVQNNIKADIVIVDPPRKGCDESVLDSIAKISPRKIVMITCDSATMSRDCKYLSQLGYKLERVRPVDMFPRTAHVETVVLMSRVEK